MSMTVEQALALVPAASPNRDTLARLLVVVEEARESSWRNRLREIAALVLVSDSTLKGSKDSHAAAGALYRAVDAARVYARKHGLKPDTRRGVLAEARAVLQVSR